VITLIYWLAALAASLTSLAMLSDMQPLQSVWAQARPLERLRHLLRGLTLVVIAASSSVCVLLPFTVGQHATPYEVMLRVGLVLHFAIQSPCPWWSYVLRGRLLKEPGDVQ
jgi:hypothetical protein